ncbi:MAG TPA: SAM-dependent methyltransferase [Streptosporangiaceae bacterium]|nr:SAM-dependent methyltransferase [Streptosporangiaceae bacterium]
MSGAEWAPAGVDVTKPSVARVYDCYLGGKDNFAVDRAVVEQTRQIFPPDWDAARGGLDNRAFLRRVVRHLVIEGGIRQFIDFGSGLPTQGNVHEIAQDIAPQARVVYVDNDPIVLVHARALLGNTETTQIITADLRRPAEILDDPAVWDFVDLSRPTGFLLFAILHHINDDEDPGAIAAELRSAMVPGSYLAISHFCQPGAAFPDDAARAVMCEKIFNEKLGTGRWRTNDEIRGYFGDLTMIDPGLVPLPEWRPDPGDDLTVHPTYRLFVGGVARKD